MGDLANPYVLSMLSLRGCLPFIAIGGVAAYPVLLKLSTCDGVLDSEAKAVFDLPSGSPVSERVPCRERE